MFNLNLIKKRENEILFGLWKWIQRIMFKKLRDEKQTNWDGGVDYGVSRNFASLEAKRKYKKGEHLLIKLEVSKSKWNKHIEAKIGYIRRIQMFN